MRVEPTCHQRSKAQSLLVPQNKTFSVFTVLVCNQAFTQLESVKKKNDIESSATKFQPALCTNNVSRETIIEILFWLC